MSYYDVFDSPAGLVFVGGSGAGLHRIDFLDQSLNRPRDEPACAALLERESGEAPGARPRGDGDGRAAAGRVLRGRAHALRAGAGAAGDALPAGGVGGAA